MPNHTIFNERPESQDRALKELQAMGYQYIPRAEAEQKRGRLSHVLFPDVMREFLSSQSFLYGHITNAMKKDAANKVGGFLAGTI